MKIMKLRAAVVLLLAHETVSLFLRANTSVSSSNRLQLESQELDKVLQAAAGAQPAGPTREFLKTLRLCAPCNHFERLGEAFDGGYVTCTDGLDKGLVGAYSYGINGFDGWGMAVASRYHIPLHEYDCTNPKAPRVCQGCEAHFHYECISNARAVPEVNFKTFSQQLVDSGNFKTKDRSLLLKIDVEAAEWQIFAEEPITNLKKFREIVVEYHWLNKVHLHDLYLRAVKNIENAGFAVAHLHGNNFGGDLQHFGKYRIPNVLEVTYIQKPANGCAAGIPYHISGLDMPNNARGPELGDAVLPTKL